MLYLYNNVTNLNFLKHPNKLLFTFIFRIFDVTFCENPFPTSKSQRYSSSVQKIHKALFVVTKLDAMQQGNTRLLPAEHISLTGNSRIYVLIHNASQILFGPLSHVDIEAVPEWAITGQRVHNPPKAQVLLHPHAVPTPYLITTEMQYSPARFNKMVKSQCFIRDNNNFYKAMLTTENSLEALRSGYQPVVMVQTVDGPTIWMGVLQHYHDKVPYWVWD